MARRDDTHLQLCRGAAETEKINCSPCSAETGQGTTCLNCSTGTLYSRLQQQQLSMTANCLDKPWQLLRLSQQTWQGTFRRSWGREHYISASAIPFPGYKNPRKLWFLCEIYKHLYCLFKKQHIAVVQRIIFKIHKRVVVQTTHKRLLCIFFLFY